MQEALASAIQAAARKVGSKRALAKELGCSAESLHRWEIGEREIGLYTAATVFELAGCPLLGGQTELYERLAGLEAKLTELAARPAYGRNDMGVRTSQEDSIKDMIAALHALEMAAATRSVDLLATQKGSNGHEQNGH